MIRLLPLIIIFLAAAIPGFLVIQARNSATSKEVRLSNAANTKPDLLNVKPAQAKSDLAQATSVASSPTPTLIPNQSVSLTIRYKPFKNSVELLSTSFATPAAPAPAKEPWQREGRFVLKVEHLLPEGIPNYTTWLSVDAVKFLNSPNSEPIHDLSVTIPYHAGSAVRFLEPTSLREYARFLIP